MVHPHGIGSKYAWLLGILLLSASVKGGLPLLLLLVWHLVSTHLIVASLARLLLHAIEELRLERATTTLRCLLHAEGVRILSIVHLFLLLLLHLHLHELLLFLHSLLRCIKIIHGLERSILCCAWRCLIACVQHAQNVVHLALLVLLHHVLLLLHHVLLWRSHGCRALEI